MRLSQLAATLLLSSIAFMPVHGLAADEADPVVATVAGVEIRASELKLAEGDLDPQFAQMPVEQRRVAALAAVIDIKTLARKAETEKLDQTEEFKTLMQFQRDRALHNAIFKASVVDPVTDADIKARYDKELAASPPEEEVSARHILLKTEEEAKAVIAELDAGKDFAELAKEKSTGPSAAQGGELGYFTKGRMVPEFEAVAFTLKAGEYAKEPVKTQFGWHVIKVEDRRETAPPEFDAISDQVRQLVMRERYGDLIKAARAEVEIDVLDPDLKTAYDTINQQK
ncbi:parvulin-like peptidyl-prolyl isomerase [Hoeflea sp. IMCC20628]|uniref:peptidylprolyl isomerase n=1 Tax=Hoeflea sp. IMCC20628 TaxID=1620421 RepID=UPI00063AA1E0|nr:peptidylprolyl isomerase [Hoeflea sp. IMCC20628]AKI03264.1 parvulin-like peptidyl-prolyl isomerase [Hoeflea sp. IMCC20628]